MAAMPAMGIPPHAMPPSQEPINPEIGRAKLHVREDNIQNWFDWTTSAKIGQGSFGDVYKAVCIKDRAPDTKGRPGLKAGTNYAVKVMKTEWLKYPKHWKNVAHEIEILKRVFHSSCITYYDAFKSVEAIYIVLELVTGGELFDVIINRGKLDEHEALDITRQIVNALIYLHSENIVHRDLKPENVLVEQESMKIKLIDFGFAKFFGKTDSYAETPSRTLNPQAPNMQALLAGLSPGAQVPASPILTTPLGSLKYLAPEILRGLVTSGVAPRVTTRKEIQKLDMFSVGVIVYVMLGGAFPFSAKTKAGLATQIQRGMKFPEKRWAGVSEEAKDFVGYLLQSDKKQRPLAIDCLNHPWIRNVPPPNTPCPELEPIQEEELRKIQLEFSAIDEMRKAESKLDKEATNEAPPQAGAAEGQVEATAVAQKAPMKLKPILKKKGAKADNSPKSEKSQDESSESQPTGTPSSTASSTSNDPAATTGSTTSADAAESKEE